MRGRRVRRSIVLAVPGIWRRDRMSSVNDQLKQFRRISPRNESPDGSSGKAPRPSACRAMWIQAPRERRPRRTSSVTQPSSDEPQSGQIEHPDHCVAENVDTFDPAFTVGSKTAQTALQNIFDQLTQYRDRRWHRARWHPLQDRQHRKHRRHDRASREPIPRTKRTWSSHIRPDAKYANGDPIDANTMVEGYSAYSDAGVSKFLLGMGGTIADSPPSKRKTRKTFVIHMSTPNTLTPKNNVMHNTSCTRSCEMRAHETDEDPWAAEYFKPNLATGNGPYKLESYLPGRLDHARRERDVLRRKAGLHERSS